MEKGELQYRILRSDRKSLSLQILPTGEVVVRCPKRMKTEQVRRFVESKKEWIMTHLSKVQADRLPPLTARQREALVDQAKARLPERADYFASILGVTYEKITVRTQRSRWGSCSSRGNLSFNALLMLAPPEVADYVVVHELCHRKEMNHSARFWNLVEQVLPDYRLQKQWLRQHGGGLLSRLPALEKQE